MKNGTQVLLLFTLALGLLAMANGRRGSDPIGNYNFRVEIAGIGAGAFDSVEGIGVELEVIDDTVPPEPIRKLPGRLKWSDITLKRGYTGESGGSALFQPFDGIRQGDDPDVRRQVSITIVRPDGGDIATLDFHECFLTGYALGPLDGRAKSDILQESVTIACEYFEMR